VSFPIKDGDFQCEFHPGWWLTYPSEKYEFVSWDDYSQLNGTIKFMFQTTNQQYFFAVATWPNHELLFKIYMLHLVTTIVITMLYRLIMIQQVLHIEKYHEFHEIS